MIVRMCKLAEVRTMGSVNNVNTKETIMWTKPEVTEMRFGFEVTMYVCNR